MQSRIIIFLFAVLFTVSQSCNKSNLNDEDVITSYSDKLEGNDRELFRLRACLAKSMAKAFEDKSFRAYFKREFCVAKDNHFKELLLIQHLNDKIRDDGTTLKQLLEQSADDEVKNLYGNNFIQMVIDNDPCVVVKLPDVFRSFEWDTDKIIPAIMPVTPNPETTFGDKHRYLCYYRDCGHTLVFDSHQYFHCRIRYSDDYFLLDPKTFTNQKDISFYEMLPQALEVQDGMKAEIIGIGKEIQYYPNKLFVNLLDAFFLWREKYAYKGNFLFGVTSCNNQNCIRACIDIQDSRLVMDTLQVNLSRIFEYQLNKFMEEAVTYSFTFWSRTDELYLRRVTVPSLPYEYFNARDISIKLLETNNDRLPKLDFKSIETGKGKPILVNAIIKEYVEPNEVIYFSHDFCFYSDWKREWRLTPPSFTSHIVSNATYAYPEQRGAISACDPPTRIHTSQSWFSYNY